MLYFILYNSDENRQHNKRTQLVLMILTTFCEAVSLDREMGWMCIGRLESSGTKSMTYCALVMHGMQQRKEEQ